MLRWPYMMPPAQSVSPTHWSTPYFSGMSMSVGEGLQAADAHAADDVAAPASASRRSVVAVTFAGSLLTATICVDDLADHVEVVRR